jgi:hypothetical protein
VSRVTQVATIAMQLPTTIPASLKGTMAFEQAQDICQKNCCKSSSQYLRRAAFSQFKMTKTTTTTTCTCTKTGTKTTKTLTNQQPTCSLTTAAILLIIAVVPGSVCTAPVGLFGVTVVLMKLLLAAVSFLLKLALTSFENETNGTVLCVPIPIIRRSWNAIDPAPLQEVAREMIKKIRTGRNCQRLSKKPGRARTSKRRGRGHRSATRRARACTSASELVLVVLALSCVVGGVQAAFTPADNAAFTSVKRKNIDVNVDAATTVGNIKKLTYANGKDETVLFRVPVLLGSTSKSDMGINAMIVTVVTPLAATEVNDQHVNGAESELQNAMDRAAINIVQMKGKI